MYSTFEHHLAQMSVERRNTGQKRAAKYEALCQMCYDAVRNNDPLATSQTAQCHCAVCVLHVHTSLNNTRFARRNEFE